MNSTETAREGQSRFIRNSQFGSRRRRLRTSGSLLTALLSLVVWLAFASASFAQSALTDDAHVSLSQGNANHGANPNLNVSPAENIYLKFKLSPTLPAATPGAAVERATLKLYVGSIKTAGKLDVHAVLGEWDENMITGNNLPPLGSLLTTTAQIGTDQRGKFLVIDITPLVRLWLGDDGQGANGLLNHGLVVVAHPVDATTPDVANITFDSKENAQTSHEAQLNIQLAGEAQEFQPVAHDVSLTGNGTTASPLGVASGGINTVHLANGAVTGEKIANNAVSSSELADGAVTSPKISAPLSLTSANPGFTLSVVNTGSGAALTAAGAINTTTQYNIGGNRVLSVSAFGNIPSSSTYAGVGAGQTNLGGDSNSFFGYRAGFENVTGSNSFFGAFSGFSNTFGFSNAFFGNNAGYRNVTGTENVFIGDGAGENNRNGFYNTVIGAHAGFNILNDVGQLNTLIGNRARVIGQLSNATAIGANSQVTQSNSLILGSISEGSINPDTNVGIGTTAPKTKLHLRAGKIYVEANGQGVILKSPGGMCFELTVTDAGALAITALACP
jgi:hypothetical protein